VTVMARVEPVSWGIRLRARSARPTADSAGVVRSELAGALVWVEPAELAGAAAVAAYGTGIWKDYEIIDRIHKTESVEKPDAESVEKYGTFYSLYQNVTHHMSEIGVLMKNIKEL
jgi:hypothetical protein